MKRTTLLLSTAAALALCSPAQAEGLKGWYVGIEAGANWVDDTDHQMLGTQITPHTHFINFDYDAGWAFLATVGYGVTENWRVELEAGYRKNDGDRLEFSPTESSSITTLTTPGGELKEFSLMANVLYEHPLSEKLSLSLGAGLGFDHADFEDKLWGSDESWNFAYQGIVGLNYAVGERSQVFLRYRYFVVPDPEFTFEGPDGHFCCQGFDNIQKHTATIGFRYFFLPPPVVVPPDNPPLPPDTKQFIIFFGYNKCNITAEADRVLSEAASTAKSTGSASLKIVGHTDTSGSAAYNQRLSDCRANATKNNLIDKGIGENQISASGRGESELMVQTADGVKEPQNRRSTIDLE
jgi:opacity protein-like surface antigen